MGLKVAAEVSTFPNQNYVICGVLRYFYPFVSSLPCKTVAGSQMIDEPI